jgi:integrase
VSQSARPTRKRDDGTTELATDAVAGVRLHDLRHTAAHKWLDLGKDFRKVSDWLGHADHTVTLMVYSDLITGEAAASENTAPEPKSVSNVLAMPGRAG